MLQSLLIGLSQEKAGNTPEGFLNNVFVLFFFYQRKSQEKL